MKRRRPVIIREGTTAEEAVSPDTKRIKLVITDRAGQVKEVEWNVEGSIFIGRSEMCNIFFDDDRLSRQHFAIEVTKVACYIEEIFMFEMPSNFLLSAARNVTIYVSFWITFFMY